MSQADPTPADVVTRAYRAANRGRFADANRYLTLRLRNMVQSSAKSIRASNRLLAATARRAQSPAKRAELQELLQGLLQFEDPHYCWKGSTQGGAVTSIEVLRQTVRKNRALVTVGLRFADGRSRVERSRLARKSNRWLIESMEVQVLQNNEMQRTKPAEAMELRR